MSAKLTKKVAAKTVESAHDVGSHAFVPFAQIRLSDVDFVSADSQTRTILIRSQGDEYEIRGWPPKKSTITTRMGSPEAHDPKSPGSPTHTAAGEIAQAASLVLLSDSRAQILHFARSDAGEARFEPTDLEHDDVNEFRIRPWKSLLLVAFIVSWVIFWSRLIPSVGASERVGDGVGLDWSNPLVLVAALHVVPLFLGAIWSLKSFVQGVTIGTDGLRWFGRGHKLTPWSDVSLLYVRTEQSDMFGRASVVVVTEDGKTLGSDHLSKRQANRVSEALVRFGTPWGVNSSVFARDFSRRPADGVKRIKSPIAEVSG